MAGMAIKEGFGKTPPPDATTKRAAQRQYEKLADMVLRAKVAVAERLLSEPDYDFEEEEAPRARISIARQQDEIKEFQLVFPSDTPHDTGKTSARPTPQMMGVATSTATPVPPTDTPNNTPSLRDAVELYIEVKLPKWGPNTPRTYLPTLRQFVEIVEDVAGHPRLPLVNLSRELIREYCSVIARLPSRCDKPGLREKRYVEIARTMTFPPAERMKPWSIREKFNKTRGLINWLEIEYDGAINATRLNAAFDMPKVPRTRGGLPKSDRRYFSQAELEALFEPSAYLEATKESPAYFWAPLVALFSGMRITEICQLLVSDLREEDDIWLIDINGEGAEFKRLKSAAARRKVPVHPFLINCLGLLDYAGRIRRENKGAPLQLFPNLAYHGREISAPVSAWFTRYRRSRGVGGGVNERSNVVFHCFRNNFNHYFGRVDTVPPSQLHALVGHVDRAKSEGMTEVYAGDYAPRKLLEDVILKLPWDKTLPALAELAVSPWARGEPASRGITGHSSRSPGRSHDQGRPVPQAGSDVPAALMAAEALR